MPRRLALLLVAVTVVGAVVSGCSGEPAPVVSTPAFASDDEAFAAAEATYRAYVDAVNARREDPHALPAPEDYLVGEALESELASNRRIAEAGLRLVGPSAVRSVTPVSYGETGDRVEALICLDASGSRVLDRAGVDVTPPDRIDIVGIEVTFAELGQLALISRTQTAATSSC